MTFNIAEFSSQINRYGLAKDNLFFVTITAPQFGADIPQNDLSFFCRSVDLPSLTISTTQIQNQGYGVYENRPTGIPLENLNTVFMVDSSFKVKQFFHRWMQGIVNYDNTRGYNREYNSMLPYETAYKEKYTGTVEVFVYSQNTNSVEYLYRFRNAYPVSIGNITTAWENNNGLMLLPVQFVYDIYEVDSFGNSAFSNRETVISSRPFGVFTSFGNAASSLINSIQDTIDLISDIPDLFNDLF